MLISPTNVLGQPTDAPVRMCGNMVSEGVGREWDRPKIAWKEVVSKGLQIFGINSNLAKDWTK